MPDINNQDFIEVWKSKGVDTLWFLLRRFPLLLLAIIIGAFAGYFTIRNVKPTYTATISFVLSTNDSRGGGGLSGLASQLGFDATTSSPDNMFTGDNIIELFKSRSLIGASLMSVVDTPSHETLINYIVRNQNPAMYKKAGAFGNNPKLYNTLQTRLYRGVIGYVSGSFMVFKKDKKLIFYLISAKSTNSNIAYYIAKYVLNETSQYFIATKTKVTATSVVLLQHEADSLGRILGLAYSSTAATIDRTYNLNPSITVQRAGSQFGIAKANAFSSAYAEVMRNLEVAKVNLQKETPLYKIIDEPELPLLAEPIPKLRHIITYSIFAFIVMFILLTAFYLYKNPPITNSNNVK